MINQLVAKLIDSFLVQELSSNSFHHDFRQAGNGVRSNHDGIQMLNCNDLVV